MSTYALDPDLGFDLQLSADALELDDLELLASLETLVSEVDSALFLVEEIADHERLLDVFRRLYALVESESLV